MEFLHLFVSFVDGWIAHRCHETYLLIEYFANLSSVYLISGQTFPNVRLHFTNESNITIDISEKVRRQCRFCQEFMDETSPSFFLLVYIIHSNNYHHVFGIYVNLFVSPMRPLSSVLNNLICVSFLVFAPHIYNFSLCHVLLKLNLYLSFLIRNISVQL